MNKGKESKPHIGIFGRRNNGKSSIINVLAGQDVAIVSEVAGTTTDPVKKSMEIPGIGPVILIDTAGIDDSGSLGKQRIEKSLHIIKTIDLAMLIIVENTFGEYERSLIGKFKEYDVPYFIVHNKSDLVPLNEKLPKTVNDNEEIDIIPFSTVYPDNLEKMIEVIRKNIPDTAYINPSILAGLVNYGDIVLLITPIDIEAPEGRLILPQVQTIRDILDNDCIAVILKEKEVDAFLKKTGIKPKLAVTDSQVFLKADASIPKDIPLTGFSILMAKLKGDFENYLKGTPKILELKDGDRILLLESCTHHVSCDDIGRVKIPRWIDQFTGKKLEYEIVSGLDELPRNIKEYALVIQCGGCVLTRKQIISRLKLAIEAGVPVTNYGMTIAMVQVIYNRAIAPFTKTSSIDYL
jgi:[FeFe] hydrogenase H-cluster maturation GTPase HydF